MSTETLTLQQLRESLNVTRSQIAERMNLPETEVLRIEHERPEITTVRRYVQALGGEIEVAAVIKGKRVVLAGV